MSPRLPTRLTLRMVIAYVTTFAVVALLIGYVAFQARYIIAGPTLDIYTIDSVSKERTVVFEGQANNIISIDLNGRTIYTDEGGYFKETIVLENGYTVATIHAQDRFGRTISATRSFVYKPVSTDALTDNSI
jgi:hypothetical protein